MTVRQLRDVLSIVNDDAEVKIKIDSWDYRKEDCYISSAEITASTDGRAMGIELHHSMHTTEDSADEK